MLGHNRVSEAVKKSSFRDRLYLILSALLFMGLFNYVYITFVATRWAYCGMTYAPPLIQSVLLVWILGLLPIFWMPIRITRPSQVLYWIIYGIIYVPSLFLPHYMQRQSTQDLYLLNISFFISFFIIGLTYKLPLRAIARPKWSMELWWFFVVVTVVFFYAAVLAVYGGRLQFDGLYNYTLRLASRELDTTFLTDYGHVWIANVINPIFMTLGLFKKKPLLFFIGVAGQVLLFLTAAQKMVLLSIALFPLLFIVLKSKTNIIGLRFLMGLSILLLVTIALGFYESLPALIVQDLISFRFLSTAGFMTSVYSDFFSHNPWTYWSHLKGVSAIVEYPYDLSINYLIGDFLGDPVNSANAHAWATDGIAAMGLTGVLVIGLLMVIIFYILDSLAVGLDPKFSGLSLAMHGIAISNTSIMSTFLGGGLFFHMIVLWLMPRYIIGVKIKQCTPLSRKKYFWQSHTPTGELPQDNT